MTKICTNTSAVT